MSFLSKLSALLQGISSVIPTIEIIIEALPRKRKRGEITPPRSKKPD